MLVISMRTGAASQPAVAKHVETELTKLREKLSSTAPEDIPETISGIVHWLWPEIKACLESGYKVTQVLRVFETSGISVKRKKGGGHERMAYDTLAGRIRAERERERESDSLKAKRESRNAR